jgi:hypothetical protein
MNRPTRHDIVTIDIESVYSGIALVGILRKAKPQRS